MDILGYTYDAGNKLVKVTDTGNATYGFKDGANLTTEYIYDANGNMKTDTNKGITTITYNHLNLPTQVTMAGGNILYIYDAVGTKLRKTVNGITTDYAGNYSYENDVLQFFSTAEGYLEPNVGTGFNYVYQYKDHLGNIRLSYKDTDSNGIIATSEIIEENNYYPFGLKHKGYNTAINGTHHKYMFGNKEFDESFQTLNTYDFGARNYDPALGRWMNVDPLASKYYNISPYTYVANSPLIFIDPDGKKIVFAKNVTKEFKAAFVKAIRYLKAHKVDGIFAKLQSRKETFTISETQLGGSFDPKTKTISWDPNVGVLTNKGVVISATTVINHEADHALREVENPKQKMKDKNTEDKNYDNKEEKRVIEGSEQRTAKALGEISEGEVTRTDHNKGEFVKTIDPTSTKLENEVLLTIPKKRLINKT